jgi:hypothetical protein
MSSIQDEAYNEVCQENRRLKLKHEAMLTKHAKEQNVVLKTLESALAEIERLKAEIEMMTEQAIKFRDMAQSHATLLARTADEIVTYDDLVAELRKAAE